MKQVIIMRLEISMSEQGQGSEARLASELARIEAEMARLAIEARESREMSYDGMVERLYDLDVDELRALAREANLIADDLGGASSE